MNSFWQGSIVCLYDAESLTVDEYRGFFASLMGSPARFQPSGRGDLFPGACILLCLEPNPGCVSQGR